MDNLNEADLLKIKQAFEKESLIEVIQTLEATLERLGYKRADRVSQFDIYLSSTIDTPERNNRVQPRV